MIQEAQKLGRHKTKREAVNAALDEYIRRRKQQAILDLFGTIEYDERTITSKPGGSAEEGRR